MRILIATDKFKHSLSSFTVCEAIKKGFVKAGGNFETKTLPLADGGDGLAEVLAYYAAFEKVSATVCNPLWQPVEATFLLFSNKKMAFIEMAQASGLHLLHPSQFNCAVTTTYGTGQLIKKALEAGVQEIVIGIGGSATNDCGIGMASALGYHFLDKNGKEVKPAGEHLIHIQAIDVTNKTHLENITVQVACDVTNYLLGEQGASKTFAPQKGATPAMVAALEEGTAHFNSIVKKELGVDMSTIKGGGAAGGLGAGCVAFLGAQIVSGAELVFSYSGAEQHIIDADIIITGEGKLDEQTWNGKLVHAVAQLCAKYNKPVIAVCGSVVINDEKLKEQGLTAAFSILNQPMPLEEAMLQTAVLLEAQAFAIASLLKIGVKNQSF